MPFAGDSFESLAVTADHPVVVGDALCKRILATMGEGHQDKLAAVDPVGFIKFGSVLLERLQPHARYFPLALLVAFSFR